MDVASQYEPIVGWPAPLYGLCEIGKSEPSVKMLLFFFQCVWIFLKLLWVCALGFTLSTRLPHIIFKCFDHACNGVFISSIKNVSYMLLWLKCFWKSGYSLNLKNPNIFGYFFVQAISVRAVDCSFSVCTLWSPLVMKQEARAS